MEDRFKLEKTLTPANIILAILSNIHDSLKWLFQIVMSLALINAISKYSNLLSTFIDLNPNNLFAIFLNLNTLVFLSFILVFIRFYFGDIRYLDLSYLELQYMYGLEKELAKFSGLKRMMDILLIITHGILFYFLSEYMNFPIKYLYFFILLLFVNIIWLAIQFFHKFVIKEGQREHRDQEEDLLMGKLEPQKPLLVWMINNFIFLVLISLVIFPGYKYKLEFGLFFSFLNSFFDFFCVWRYYFPSLKLIYDELGKIEKEESH